MIINLLVAILSTNVLFAGNLIHEGLKNRKKKEKLTKKTDPSGATAQEEKAGEYQLSKPTTENYTQKNIKSSQPAAATESEEDEAIGKRIDYASTLEQAYDNLQQMLGPEGINGLSKETKNLVSQQKTLLTNLNDMGPVLKTAKDTLESLSGNMPNLNNLQSMMKQFGGIAGLKKGSK